MPSNNAEYQKKYYAENKEHMIAMIKINCAKIIQCPICHTDVRKASMCAHKKTKLHLYIASQLIRTPLAQDDVK